MKNRQLPGRRKITDVNIKMTIVEHNDDNHFQKPENSSTDFLTFLFH